MNNAPVTLVAMHVTVLVTQPLIVGGPVEVRFDLLHRGLPPVQLIQILAALEATVRDWGQKANQEAVEEAMRRGPAGAIPGVTKVVP